MLELTTIDYPVVTERKDSDIILFKWYLTNVLTSDLSTSEEKAAAMKALESNGAIATLLSSSTLPLTQIAGILLDYHLSIENKNTIRVYTVALPDNRKCEVKRYMVDGEEVIGIDMSHLDGIHISLKLDSIGKFHNIIAIEDDGESTAEQLIGKIPWIIEFCFDENGSVTVMCSFRSFTKAKTSLPPNLTA